MRITTKELFKKLDENADGRISRAEWRAALLTLGVCGPDGSPCGVEALDHAFDFIDENGDEFLTSLEVDKVLRKRTETGALASIQAATRGKLARAEVEAECSAEGEKLREFTRHALCRASPPTPARLYCRACSHTRTTSPPVLRPCAVPLPTV